MVRASSVRSAFNVRPPSQPLQKTAQGSCQSHLYLFVWWTAACTAYGVTCRLFVENCSTLTLPRAA